jgi:anti-anti-sigma regulatory factor
MEKKPKSTINIAKEIAPVLGSRDLANNLKKAILQTKTKLVDLDFSEVDFISRSAAHALLSLKEDLLRLPSRKKEIAFINANNYITEMFRIVAANRALPKKRKPHFKPKKVSIESLIKTSAPCSC